MSMIPQTPVPGTPDELADAHRRQLRRGRYYLISAAARRLVKPIEFRNDHGDTCTCLACVVDRSKHRLEFRH